jgi:hypothetical protein
LRTQCTHFTGKEAGQGNLLNEVGVAAKLDCNSAETPPTKYNVHTFVELETQENILKQRH